MYKRQAHRTLQYLATSTPEHEEPNRVLLVIHGTEAPTDIVLPDLDDAVFVDLWSSADETPSDIRATFAPGDVVALPGASMRLFRVD